MIRHLFVCSIFLFGAQAESGDPNPRLVDRVVHFTRSDGKDSIVEVSRKCTDLWVAPDQSVITFVAIDRQDGEVSPGQPFITASTIFVARKDRGFVPLEISPIIPRFRQMDWKVVREPRVAQDGNTVYFTVPVAATYWALLSYDIRLRKTNFIADVVSYCSVWRGRDAGSLLFQTRSLTPSAMFVTHECSARDKRGNQSRLSADCEDFEAVAREWSGKSGGWCR